MFYGRVARDIYMAQLKPEEIEFGHVCESPHDWEQRFEKINLAEHSRKGKVFRKQQKPNKKSAAFFSS